MGEVFQYRGIYIGVSLYRWIAIYGIHITGVSLYRGEVSHNRGIYIAVSRYRGIAIYGIHIGVSIPLYRDSPGCPHIWIPQYMRIPQGARGMLRPIKNIKNQNI